jgi:hypothetical protein
MSQAISYINRIVRFCRISVLFTFFDILCGLDNPGKNLTTFVGFLAFGYRIPRESDHDWQANLNRLLYSTRWLKRLKNDV